MNSAWEILFGSGTDLSALQMADRAFAVFALTFLMLRVSGRRSLGQHRAFDGCATVLLGSVLSRAVVGASAFWPTMAAGLAIVVAHRSISWLSARSPSFERFIAGDKRELVVDGARDHGSMRAGLISDRDLDEAVRAKTGDERTPLERAVLERDGTVTVKSLG